MAIAWPEGVEIKLQREGYTRAPEDVVLRLEPDAGPSLRRLLDVSRRQRVTGTLRLRQTEAELFRAFRKETLLRGSRLFDWVVTDTGKPSPARFLGPPAETEGVGRTQIFQLEIELAAPEVTPEEVNAIAALDGAGPADWPAGLRFHPLRGDWNFTPADVVLRSGDLGLQTQRVIALGEGAAGNISLRMSRADVAVFEDWFVREAIFGVRPVRVPLRGGLRQGAFEGAYTVTPGLSEDFVVTFPFYFEALA